MNRDSRPTTREFFNRSSEQYHHNYRSGAIRVNPALTEAARRLEPLLVGDVLCVGGLWSPAKLDQVSARVTVVDSAAAMLPYWKDYDTRLLCADGRQLPFADNSFDFVVLPMVLHHIVGNSARTARRNVRKVFSEAHRLLRCGGTISIIDFTLPRLVYGAELALAPITRRLLGARGIPLVVMHSASFYESELRDAGFEHIDVARLSHGRSLVQLVSPVVGLPWFKLPLWALPTRTCQIFARSNE